MDFQSVLSLFHIAAIVLGVSAFLVLLRQLGTKTLAAGRTAALRFNVRITSYTMLLGLFFVCLSAGALLSYTILITSQLPPKPLLVIRLISLTGLCISSISLHVLAMPMLKHSSGHNLVDTASASHILASSLAASLAFPMWIIWILTGTHAEIMQHMDLVALLPATASLTGVLWFILSVFLLGERGYRELWALCLRIKKALTPPTQIEIQRSQRMKRMHRMPLPMAPRRRAAV
jgi:hypothetical protein